VTGTPNLVTIQISTIEGTVVSLLLTVEAVSHFLSVPVKVPHSVLIEKSWVILIGTIIPG
jgi:hypothetical protein